MNLTDELSVEYAIDEITTLEELKWLNLINPIQFLLSFAIYLDTYLLDTF